MSSTLTLIGEKQMARINMYGKTRDVTNPYAIYVQGDYELRVLKTYRNPENERKREKSQFISWFTAAKSPATHGSFDMGDMYKDAVLEGTRLVYGEPEWIEDYARNGDEAAGAMANYRNGLDKWNK
jgi:hypothetical protein